MNCPMKNLLMEFTTTATTTTATTPAASMNIGAGMNSCMDSRMSIVTGRTCVGDACTECCALLAFKYIAACKNVVEFQRKVREVMRKYKS